LVAVADAVDVSAVMASARFRKRMTACVLTPCAVASFAPQVAEGCRVLILGTVPSLRSLEMRQSYAHSHNLFWPFMEILFGVPAQASYAERVVRLHDVGIGLWDVLQECERRGSLDSSIRVSSEVPNHIPALLRAYPEIHAIALNGSKALQVFERRIAPRIPSVCCQPPAIIALPSTSPANASIPRATKLRRWRALLRWSREPATDA
jgi:TDG/mug DNA glycosylase family protein